MKNEDFYIGRYAQLRETMNLMDAIRILVLEIRVEALEEAASVAKTEFVGQPGCPHDSYWRVDKNSIINIIQPIKTHYLKESDIPDFIKKHIKKVGK